MKSKQVKSKKRVADHGEVFTSEREVNAMLDLVKQETERIESRFLEPACGTGNFLAEILNRKLTMFDLLKEIPRKPGHFLYADLPPRTKYTKIKQISAERVSESGFTGLKDFQDSAFEVVCPCRQILVDGIMSFWRALLAAYGTKNNNVEVLIKIQIK